MNIAANVISRSRAMRTIAGAGALLAAPNLVLAQPMTALRIGLVPTDGASVPLYAKDLGAFEKAGIDAQIQSMPGAGAIAAALAGGALDIGYGPVDVVAAVHAKGIPIAVLAPASEYVSPAMQRSVGLVVPANSPAKTAKDLNGKTVASNGLKSFGEAAAKAWIDQNGGDSSTCKWVEMPFPAMPAAIEAGRVDAAEIVEPFLAPARTHGTVLGYGYDAIAKRFIIGTWYTTPQWAKDHADVVRRFVSAMRETANWANANPSKSAVILARELKLDPAVVATIIRAHYPERWDDALAQPLIDVGAKYNGFTPVRAAELFFRS